MLIPRRARDETNSEPDSAPDAGQEAGDSTDLARRMLAHAARPEEKLEQLLAERRRELEEQAARFEEAMRDLERREELLQDMRSSVERLLRLGASDLTEREIELQELGREFMQREARLSEEEAELNRRRSELGAVELKREAVEHRERALAAREAELDTVDAEGGEEPSGREEAEPAPAARTKTRAALLFVPGPAYRLVEIEPRALEPGAVLDLDGVEYAVSRLGSSPLPADGRLCAYLERDTRGASASGGSS